MLGMNFALHVRAAGTIIAFGALIGFGSVSGAQDLPPDKTMIQGTSTGSARDDATNDVLELNSMMFGLYKDSAAISRQNILAQHPLILALFSGAGGQFILYRPNEEPLEAEPVPIVYQLLKSMAHSTMALAVVVSPYVDGPADQAWVNSLVAFRTQMQAALDGLDATEMQDDWHANNRSILENNLAFMDEILAKRAVTSSDLQVFATKQRPLLEKNVAWAAQTQVGHWMAVVADWKAQLGSAWAETYAASNTIYVARQNNILFSVLAQYFGPEAINDRLMLIETTSFTTTPEEMLVSLTRIIADRSVGEVFFGNYRLMDYELMGGDARDAIIAESNKRGMTPFLPPLAPFGSTQWPMLITPGDGPGLLSEVP